MFYAGTPQARQVIVLVLGHSGVASWCHAGVMGSGNRPLASGGGSRRPSVNQAGEQRTSCVGNSHNGQLEAGAAVDSRSSVNRRPAREPTIQPAGFGSNSFLIGSSPDSSGGIRAQVRRRKPRVRAGGMAARETIKPTTHLAVCRGLWGWGLTCWIQHSGCSVNVQSFTKSAARYFASVLSKALIKQVLTNLHARQRSVKIGLSTGLRPLRLQKLVPTPKLAGGPWHG